MSLEFTNLIVSLIALGVSLCGPLLGGLVYILHNARNSECCYGAFKLNMFKKTDIELKDITN